MLYVTTFQGLWLLISCAQWCFSQVIITHPHWKAPGPHNCFHRTSIYSLSVSSVVQSIHWYKKTCIYGYPANTLRYKHMAVLFLHSACSSRAWDTLYILMFSSGPCAGHASWTLADVQVDLGDWGVGVVGEGAQADRGHGLFAERMKKSVIILRKPFLSRYQGPDC